MNRIYENTMQLVKINTAVCFDLLFVIPNS